MTIASSAGGTPGEMTLTFTDDGKTIMGMSTPDGQTHNMEGTYTVNGDQLTITQQGHAEEAWSPPTGNPHFAPKAKSVIWLMLSGLVSLVLVWLLWSQWPVAGAWVIGVFIGIDLLLTGISMIVLAITARRIRSSGYVDTINL